MAASRARDGLSRHGTECSSTNIPAYAAPAAGDLFSLFLLVVPQELGRSDTYEGAFGEVAPVVRALIILSSLFADVHHALVAAIIFVATVAADLRYRVVGTELPADATVVFVLADPSLGVVLTVPRIPIADLGPLDDLVVGLVPRGDVDRTSCFLNDYRLTFANDDGLDGLLRPSQVLGGPGVATDHVGFTVLTVVIIPLRPVVALVKARTVVSVVARLTLDGARDHQFPVAGGGVFTPIYEVALAVVVCGDHVASDCRV